MSAKDKDIEGASAVDFEMELIKGLRDTGSELTADQLVIIHDYCIGIFALGYESGLECLEFYHEGLG